MNSNFLVVRRRLIRGSEVLERIIFVELFHLERRSILPLSTIAADDPVTCAIYARENNLLELPGWKRFKGIAKRQKKMFRMANQAKLRSYRTTPKYQYGFEVPRDYDHAVRIDKQNGNTKWQDATSLEMKQLDEYDTFQDLGTTDKPPPGYKKIRVHLVFAVKHDGDTRLDLLPMDTLPMYRSTAFILELYRSEDYV